MTPRPRVLAALVAVLSVLPVAGAHVEPARADEFPDCSPLFNCDPVEGIDDIVITTLVASRPVVGDDGPSRGPQEAFALGSNAGSCGFTGCYALFHSGDSGRTWEKRAGEGLGEQRPSDLLLVPDYPDDPRLYAVTETGLRLSTDGGDTFRQVVEEPIEGPAAMSPLFSDGDERILLGNQVAWVYDGNEGLTTPWVTAPPSDQAKFFAFAPDYAASRLLFVGTTINGPDPSLDRPKVYRCIAEVCDDGVDLVGPRGAPRVKVSSRFAQDGLVFAWDSGRFFRSTDRGASYERIPMPYSRMGVTTLSDDGQGNWYAALSNPFNQNGGILVSTDGGATWTLRGADTPLARGARTVLALANGHVLSTGSGDEEAGVLCSVNRGLTWERRCP